MALSNGHGSRYDDVWHFDPSPLMPTYLFAFVVGRLDAFCSTSFPLPPSLPALPDVGGRLERCGTG